MVRLVLAATLGASYGIYGPAFELMEAGRASPASEEYLNSEKYQIRHWNRDDPTSLQEFIARVNRIRRENAPLQSDRGLTFTRIDNDTLIAYSKTNGSRHRIGAGGRERRPALRAVGLGDNSICSSLGLPAIRPFQMDDLLSGARFLWQGTRNFVSLDPEHSPAHIFRDPAAVRHEKRISTISCRAAASHSGTVAHRSRLLAPEARDAVRNARDDLTHGGA